MTTETTARGATLDAPYGVRPPGYRLPAETRLGAVRLQVADVARSLAYYGGVLGMRTLRRDGAGAVLGAEDGTPLVELVERPGARPVPRRGRLGLYHFAILLPDRAALGRFVAHLAAVGERAGASDHRVSEALYLSDPDGLGIEVYADRPRASWGHADGQLLMDTAALDVRDVVRAAGGAPWTGMPAGTTMGHVHLHVADIDRASAFYHGGLGLDRVVWGYPGALFLSAGGYHHHLGVNDWAGSDALPSGPDDARLLEWRVHLPTSADVAAAASSVRATGAAVTEADGGWTAADPWGTVVRVATPEAAPIPLA
jgi:catechol 2,3-dioxygenase